VIAQEQTCRYGEFNVYPLIFIIYVEILKEYNKCGNFVKGFLKNKFNPIARGKKKPTGYRIYIKLLALI